MLVWGSKGGVADLGPQGSRPCAVCEKERSFRLMLQYKISHVWYVFKWVSEKQYAVVCEVCQRGEKLVTQVVEAKLGKPKLPTTSGRAWIAVVAVVPLLFLLGSLNAPRQAERTKEMLASPQTSDIYVMNIAPLQKSPQSLAMYGLLRVRKVDGDRLEFDTPAIVYGKVARANKDLQNGKLADPGYFVDTPLVLTRDELAALHRSGTLYSIERR
jgi:hypothetical protein